MAAKRNVPFDGPAGLHFQLIPVFVQTRRQDKRREDSKDVFTHVLKFSTNNWRPAGEAQASSEDAEMALADKTYTAKLVKGWIAAAGLQAIADKAIAEHGKS